MTRSEGARERETIRYYQTWLESSRGFLSPKNITRDDPLQHDADDPRHEATEKISRDKALVAFAQLGCLRLNTKRSVVTLISSSTTYILAEATKTLSLLSGGQHAAGDELWFGTASMPRSQGISENALDGSLYTARYANGRTYVAPALVFEDLTKEPRFSTREYVSNSVTFYAGVPITSKNGFNIGVFNVTDDKPRPGGISAEELQFMQDVASTIMDHLENIRNDTARSRGEKLVLGLGAFAEGQATMELEADSVSAIDISSQASKVSLRRPTFLGMTITDTDTNALHQEMFDHSSDSEEEQPTDSEPVTDIGQSADVGGDATSPSTVTSKPRQSQAVSTDANSSLPREYLQTFARAANILRQCTGSDGVMFFDAHCANIGDDYRANADNQTGDGSDTTTSSEDGAMSGSSGSTEDLAEYPFDKISLPGRSTHIGSRYHKKNQKCEVLGYSFRVSSVANTSGKHSQGLVLMEREMRRFVKTFSSGKVFHFSKEGEVSSSDESSNRDQIPDVTVGIPIQTKSKHNRQRMLANELIKVVPGARNVIWLPLWNFAKARWIAGCFIWSTRPDRLITAQDDLLYMKAFGNTIMNEINRLEVVVSDQAKTSFVANISHELRSPLHGILGSIEFLQDTAVDPFQASMITTVEICGKTLLDTVNHVLEFAKMSKRSTRESRRIGGERPKKSSQAEQDAAIDLSLIVEEVVEAIYAGQTFRSTGAFHGDEETGPISPTVDTLASNDHLMEHTPSKFAGAVRIILDIERAVSWHVRTQPGAIRRIVMNLFGNALKYTERGFVCVSLHSIKRATRSKSDLMFCITVSDTGKGMSTDFVKNHAMEAFSQEDSFSHGVGLGLSIVRQITSSLGGKIDLQSSQGKGTNVKVQMTVPLSSISPNESESELDSVVRRVKGLTLCILDPVDYEVSGAHLDSDMKLTEDAFERQAVSWFGMKVVRASSIIGIEADFFVYVEPPPAHRLLLMYGVESQNTGVPLIILSSNAFEATSLRRDTQKLKGLGRRMEIISQPCGPQKLARAIERCLDRGPFAAPPDMVSPWLTTKADEMSTIDPQVTIRTDPKSVPSAEPSIKGQSDLTMESVTTDRSSNQRKVTPSASVQGLSVPMTTSSSSQMLTGEKELPTPDFQGPVLLVDDNEVNLKLLVAFVRKVKYSYETATNGLEALNIYKDASQDAGRAFKAVVIDIQMPVMDGVTATREIRSFESKNRLAPANILALTGLASDAMREKCTKAGVDHFLAKPVKFKEFLKLLEQ